MAPFVDDLPIENLGVPEANSRKIPFESMTSPFSGYIYIHTFVYVYMCVYIYTYYIYIPLCLFMFPDPKDFVIFDLAKPPGC